jgi:predicted dehydrogenase
MGVFQKDPALAAGEDVYVEKPLCRTPEEARAVTASAPMALGAQAALVVQLANRSLREGRRTLFP